MVQKKDANGSWFSWLVSFERFTFDHGHPGQEWISQITDDEALRRHEKNKKVYAKVKVSKDKETLLQYIYRLVVYFLHDAGCMHEEGILLTTARRFRQ